MKIFCIFKSNLQNIIAFINKLSSNFIIYKLKLTQQGVNRHNKMNCELMLTYDTPAYMFNVYKNQLSRQTGSRNLTGLKMLPTIWHTYMKFVTKYQISAINSCWEKCDEKYLGRTEGWTEVKQYTPLRWSWGIIIAPNSAWSTYQSCWFYNGILHIESTGSHITTDFILCLY